MAQEHPLARLLAPSAAEPRDAERAAARPASVVVSTREVLETVAPAVYRAVRAILGREHADVEDVAQDALVAFLRGLSAFRGECSSVHYACRIAARIAIAKRRAARRTTALPREEDLVGSAALPDDEARAASRRALLRQLLEELPEEQAETLVLKIVLEFSTEEIAAATGVPLNTVRSRLRLAREALAKRIRKSSILSEELEVEK